MANNTKGVFNFVIEKFTLLISLKYRIFWQYLFTLLTELKMAEWKSKVPYSSSSHNSIAGLKNVLADGRLTSSPPLPLTTHPLSHPPTTPIPYTYWGGLWVSQRVWGGGGRGAELINQPPYVGVEHRITLAANEQCHIRIPFILFSILSSLILWLYCRYI